jgi:hypothetical protein
VLVELVAGLVELVADAVLVELVAELVELQMWSLSQSRA